MLDALSSSSLKGALDALAERVTKLSTGGNTDAVAASRQDFAANLARFSSADNSAPTATSNAGANSSGTASGLSADVLSILQLFKTLSTATRAAAEKSSSESQPLVSQTRVSSDTSTGTGSSTGTTSAGASSQSTAQAPFSTYAEFKSWESGLGDHLAEGYQPPDYIHAMGLSHGGGDDEAFKRYVFFKNNPECAVDYERIRNGQLSQCTTDGSTLRDNGHAAYRLASYDTGTGNLVDLDGKQYNPVTGTLQA